MLKVKNNIGSEIMKLLFALKVSPYDLRNNNSFKRRRLNSAWHDTESVSYLGLNLNLSMLSNSKSKGGSLNDVHAEYAKYILGKWSL